MKIAIVGAGLAGLSAASLLARDGHRVEILERASRPEPVGAGLLLQPPGIDILDRLGALHSVAETAARITRIDCRTANGRHVLDVDYGYLHSSLHGFGLTRPAIWAALIASAEAAGVTINPGCTVTSIYSDEDGADLEIGGVRTRYDLVVLASGTHSRLWASPGAHKSNPYRWGCLWATVALPASWDMQALQQRVRGTKKMIGILPLGGRMAAMYWSVRNDRVGDWRDQPMQRWVDEVGEIYPEAADLVADLAREEITHATYRDVWVDPPFQGRVVVIGDAAHGTSPQLGQGTTQAFRDALALTEALRGEARLSEQLDAYWKVRRKRTRYYRHTSRLLTPVFQTDFPLLGIMRDLFAGPIGAIPYVRKQSVLTVAGLKTGFFSDDWAGTER